MDAEKLRRIQDALLRDFADPTIAPCAPERAHLVYAHKAEVVDATALLPRSYPDFESRVDAWTWPTLDRYEACGVIKHNEPYRDFIRARFLWKELPDVLLTELPPVATTPDPTAEDGGTLIMLQDGSSLGDGTTPVTVKVEVPEQEGVPAGYPTIRRVCLSVPGEEGSHGEINTPDAPDTNTVTLDYPEPNLETELRLVGVMPWFRFEFPQGTAVDEDPWEFELRYGVNTESQRRQHLYEVSSQTDVGDITRYNDEGVYYFGFRQRGEASKTAVRGAYADDLSQSRRLILAAVMNVEGGPAAVTSYDGPKASWGMNQWTWPRNAATGEIHQILCYVYDFFPEAWDRCFGRYGIGMSFSSRNSSWSPTTYNDPVLFRVPCCTPDGEDPSIDTGLTDVGEHLELEELHGTIATSFAITDRSKTTSAAMLFILHKAGNDTDIQTAQVQWTSYRITYGKRDLRNPTNDEVLSAFLVSLRASVSDEDRHDHAEAGIAAGEAEGHEYPALSAAFDDTGTTEEWRDWGVRCENAGKETV